MKRFLSIVLALCMVFALCACGNDTNNGGGADSGKYDKISIDLSCNGQSDTANDCIGANLSSSILKSSPAVRSPLPFTTTISLPAET